MLCSEGCVIIIISCVIIISSICMAAANKFYQLLVLAHPFPAHTMQKYPARPLAKFA